MNDSDIPRVVKKTKKGVAVAAAHRMKITEETKGLVCDELSSSVQSTPRFKPNKALPVQNFNRGRAI